MMTRTQSTELSKQWEERVAAFRASGQSGAAWCAAHNLKPHQLWYWVKRFRKKDARTVAASCWLPVEVAGPESGGVQESSVLITIGQATVEVKPGFNPQTLSDVVKVLVSLC